jgi:hypothetical protein
MLIKTHRLNSEAVMCFVLRIVSSSIILRSCSLFNLVQIDSKIYYEFKFKSVFKSVCIFSVQTGSVLPSAGCWSPYKSTHGSAFPRA